MAKTTRQTHRQTSWLIDYTCLVDGSVKTRHPERSVTTTDLLWPSFLGRKLRLVFSIRGKVHSSSWILQVGTGSLLPEFLNVAVTHFCNHAQIYISMRQQKVVFLTCFLHSIQTFALFLTFSCTKHSSMHDNQYSDLLQNTTLLKQKHATSKRTALCQNA